MATPPRRRGAAAPVESSTNGRPDARGAPPEGDRRHRPGSRRASEALIAAGRVRVDAVGRRLARSWTRPEKDRGRRDPDRRRVPDDVPLLHKPVGVTSTTQDRMPRRPCSISFRRRWCRTGPVSIRRRLEQDSEGLLILTNDGVGPRRCSPTVRGRARVRSCRPPELSYEQVRRSRPGSSSTRAWPTCITCGR